MITNVVDLSVLNTVADLLGVSPDKIKPVYDQMKVLRGNSAPAQILNFNHPCLLLGSFYRVTSDLGSSQPVNLLPRFLFGNDDTAFDLSYSRPSSSAYEKEVPVIFDNISFPANNTLPCTLIVSFVRFELL